MKRDEPLNLSNKSKNTPLGLKFRPAELKDCSAILSLLSERNPTLETSTILTNTIQGIQKSNSDPKFKIYVADLHADVIGFCRFRHSDSMVEDKKKFQSPIGWYGTGIIVDSKFRRQNVARFLSMGRIELLKTQGVREIYSIVDTSNFTSIKMHQEFGFCELSRAQGFLHLDFFPGQGILFRLRF